MKRKGRGAKKMLIGGGHARPPDLRHRSLVKRMSARSGRPPAGFRRNSAGLLLPSMFDAIPEPVPPRKLAAGLEAAKHQIKKLMRGLDDLTEGFSVQEVELAVSFSADGKFLGVGVGGATTVTLKLKPDAP